MVGVPQPTWKLAGALFAEFLTVISCIILRVSFRRVSLSVRRRLFPRQLASLAFANLIFALGATAQDILEFGYFDGINNATPSRENSGDLVLFGRVCTVTARIFQFGRHVSVLIQAHISISFVCFSFHFRWSFYWLAATLKWLWLVGLVLTAAEALSTVNHDPDDGYIIEFFARASDGTIWLNRPFDNNFCLRNTAHSLDIVAIGSLWGCFAVIIAANFAMLLNSFRRRGRSVSIAVARRTSLYPLSFVLSFTLVSYELGTNFFFFEYIGPLRMEEFYFISIVLQHLNGFLNASCYLWQTSHVRKVFRRRDELGDTAGVGVQPWESFPIQPTPTERVGSWSVPDRVHDVPARRAPQSWPIVDPRDRGSDHFERTSTFTWSTPAINRARSEEHLALNSGDQRDRDVLLMLCYLEGLDLVGDSSRAHGRRTDGVYDDHSFSFLQEDHGGPRDVAPAVPSLQGIVWDPNNDGSWGRGLVSVRCSNIPVMLEQVFVTIGCLGRGAFGRVDLVKARCQYGDIVEGERYAIKHMDTRNDRTYQEREVLRSARHPGIVRFVTALKTDTAWALIMEYCPGGDLEYKVERDGTPGLPLELVRRYAAETLDALSYLHSSNILHRDLNPSNIFPHSSRPLQSGRLGLREACEEHEHVSRYSRVLSSGSQ